MTYSKKRAESIRILKTIHGDGARGKVKKEYRAWLCMKDRCMNPNNSDYARYGGRGIKICTQWQYSYPTFLIDMGRAPSKKHSLDRINNEGNYEPGNCRWATQKQQVNNRALCILVNMDGDIKTLKEWCSIKGAKYQRVYDRITKLSWPVKKAFALPKYQRKCTDR